MSVCIDKQQTKISKDKLHLALGTWICLYQAMAHERENHFDFFPLAFLLACGWMVDYEFIIRGCASFLIIKFIVISSTNRQIESRAFLCLLRGVKNSVNTECQICLFSIHHNPMASVRVTRFFLLCSTTWVRVVVLFSMHSTAFSLSLTLDIFFRFCLCYAGFRILCFFNYYSIVINK